MTLSPYFETALHYSGRALLAAGLQLLLLFGPLLLFGLLMHFVSLAIRNRGTALFGPQLLIWLSAPGTVIHEFGHAFFCVLFGHEIKEISLFSPQKNGVLGYVRHSWEKKSLWQNAGNFFIGTGPIWFGTALLLLAVWLLFGSSLLAPFCHAVPVEKSAAALLAGLKTQGAALFDAISGMAQAVRSQQLYRDYRFYLLLYLFFCIGSQITLSPADLAGAADGLKVIVPAVIVFNLATLWLGDFATTSCLQIFSFGSLLWLLLIFALLFNLLVALLLALLALFRP